MKELEELKKNSAKTQDVYYLFATLVKVIQELKKALIADLKEVDVKIGKIEKGDKGEKGNRGEDGKDGINGKDGKNYTLTEVDKKEIAKKIIVPVVEKVIEKTEIIKEQPIVTNQIVKEIVTEFDTTEIDNKIKELEEMINALKTMNPRSVFGGRAVQVLGSNTKVGTKTNEINFGTGLTVTEVNGRITIEATGGAGGFTKETPTGNVDGSNTVFTVTTEPNYVISDGITLFDGNGYVYAALTITLTNAPTQFIRSYY